MTVGTPRTRAPGPRSSPVLLPRSLRPLLPLPPPVTPSCRNDAHARSRATTAGDLSPSRYSCGVPIPWGSRGSADHGLRAGARRLLTLLDSVMNRPHPPPPPPPSGRRCPRPPCGGHAVELQVSGVGAALGQAAPSEDTFESSFQRLRGRRRSLARSGAEHAGTSSSAERACPSVRVPAGARSAHLCFSRDREPSV